MNFLLDKQGNISLLRVSIVIAVIGAVFLGGSALTFFFDQQSRGAPLSIDLPQGAEAWGSPTVRGTGWQETFYRVPGGNLDLVAQHYDRKMREFYGGNISNVEVCIRFPPAGVYSNSANDPNVVFQKDFVPGTSLPVYWRCMFDRSGLNSTQWTQVTLYDGLSNTDPNLNSFGSVVIIYEQRWDAR